MEILSFIKEREETEEMFVTEIALNNGDEFTLASYKYNGELSPEETAPSIWNSDEFNELDENLQKEIIKKVNEQF